MPATPVEANTLSNREVSVAVVVSSSRTTDPGAIDEGAERAADDPDDAAADGALAAGLEPALGVVGPFAVEPCEPEQAASRAPTPNAPPARIACRRFNIREKTCPSLGSPDNPDISHPLTDGSLVSA